MTQNYRNKSKHEEDLDLVWRENGCDDRMMHCAEKVNTDQTLIKEEYVTLKDGTKKTTHHERNKFTVWH